MGEDMAAGNGTSDARLPIRQQEAEYEPTALTKTGFEAPQKSIVPSDVMLMVARAAMQQSAAPEGFETFKLTENYLYNFSDARAGAPAQDPQPHKPSALALQRATARAGDDGISFAGNHEQHLLQSKLVRVDTSAPFLINFTFTGLHDEHNMVATSGDELVAHVVSPSDNNTFIPITLYTSKHVDPKQLKEHGRIAFNQKKDYVPIQGTPNSFVPATSPLTPIMLAPQNRNGLIRKHGAFTQIPSNGPDGQSGFIAPTSACEQVVQEHETTKTKTIAPIKYQHHSAQITRADPPKRDGVDLPFASVEDTPGLSSFNKQAYASSRQHFCVLSVEHTFTNTRLGSE